MKIPLDKLTNHVQQALNVAAAQAVKNRLPAVTPEVLLLCLLEQKDSGASRLISPTRLAAIRNRIETQRASSAISHPPIASQTTLIIEESALIALEFSTPFVSTEHVILAMMRSSEFNLGELLSLPSAELQRMEARIIDHLTLIGELWDQRERSQSGILDIPSSSGVDDLELPSNSSLLERYAKELTNPACDLSPVIGRETEITRLCEILSRKTKNNPLLIGDAGVGKTAIVEGLAQRIAAGTCPAALADKKIYALDISALIAGTMFRGEFESRLKDILTEVKKNPQAIIFIDEIHTIMGAGSTHGSLDLANIIKPALARGEIRCIGATTYAEFNKYIKQDLALERRFQPLAVDEPGRQDTLKMLHGLIHHYSSFHGIRIPKTILESLIDLTHQHMPHRKFPDKAIDVLDEACAMIKLRQPISKLDREISLLERTIQRALEQKERAIFFENLAQAQRLADKIESLQKDLQQLKSKRRNTDELPELTENDIAAVISAQQHIPLSHILKNFHDSQAEFLSELHASILGQAQAVEDINEVLVKAHLGLRAEDKPQASLLFTGPTGVGKTHAAKIIAKTFFGSEEAILRLDMADFQERHHVSKLTGAPAGYVGYREESLFHHLIKKPNTVVLFDEIDKAHPDVLNSLLSILDTGLLTDASGQLISFRHSIIILTSNAGNNLEPIGFGGEKTSHTSHAVIEKFMRKELLHRIQKLVKFAPLNAPTLAELAHRELQESIRRLNQRKIRLTFAPALPQEIAEQAIREGGARSIRRLIDQSLMNQIIKTITLHPKKKSIHLTSLKEPVTS